jgi:hypothetical protein
MSSKSAGRAASTNNDTMHLGTHRPPAAPFLSDVPVLSQSQAPATPPAALCSHHLPAYGHHTAAPRHLPDHLNTHPASNNHHLYTIPLMSAPNPTSSTPTLPGAPPRPHACLLPQVPSPLTACISSLHGAGSGGPPVGVLGLIWFERDGIALSATGGRMLSRGHNGAVQALVKPYYRASLIHGPRITVSQ